MRFVKCFLVVGFLSLFATSRAGAVDKTSSGCWPWPDSMDAVAASPLNHSVLFEDSNIRFLDVHTPPHTINGKHDHQWLSVFLQDEAQPRGRDHGTDGTVSDGSAANGGGNVGPDAAFPLLNIAGPQAPHAFENVDTFTKHFYRAELKQIVFECPAKNGEMVSYNKDRLQTVPEIKVASWKWPASMDAIITSPSTDKVLFENFDIRLVEVTVRPGQKQNMGETMYPSVLLFYEPQPEGLETSYDGVTTTVERKFHGAKFPQAIRMGKRPPHAFENKDTIPAHYYRVEFKRITYKG
jgi:hypothetical protein